MINCCPRCGGAELWDDNLWSGCDRCGYAWSDEGATMILAKDLPGLARTVAEVEQAAGITRLDYLPRLVPGGAGPDPSNSRSG